MAETPKPQNQEAFNAFVKHYNLDPLNKDAINNCLFDIAKRIDIVKSVDINGIATVTTLAESFK